MDEEPIKTTVEEIRKVLNLENVIGAPIETEDKIMIPVTRFGMGFGAGMGEGRGPDGQGGGGQGAGGATGVEPIAMIVVFKDVKGPEGVKLLSLKPPNPMSQAIGELGKAIVEVMRESPMMSKKPGKKVYKTEELTKKSV
jgi:uncharacterized spore protein YtfJ